MILLVPAIIFLIIVTIFSFINYNRSKTRSLKNTLYNSFEVIDNNFSYLDSNINSLGYYHDIDMAYLNSSLSSFKLDYNNKIDTLEESISQIQDHLGMCITFDNSTEATYTIKTGTGNVILADESDGTTVKTAVTVNGYKYLKFPQLIDNVYEMSVFTNENDNNYEVVLTNIESGEELLLSDSTMFSIKIYKPCPVAAAV